MLRSALQRLTATRPWWAVAVARFALAFVLLERTYGTARTGVYAVAVGVAILLVLGAVTRLAAAAAIVLMLVSGAPLVATLLGIALAAMTLALGGGRASMDRFLFRPHAPSVAPPPGPGPARGSRPAET